MNSKTIKLIKAYCEFYKKPADIYIERYKKLSIYNKTKVRESIIKALPN